MKKCPLCAEEIQDEAIRCKHCQADLTPQEGRQFVCSFRDENGKRQRLCFSAGSEDQIKEYLKNKNCQLIELMPSNIPNVVPIKVGVSYGVPNGSVKNRVPKLKESAGCGTALLSLVIPGLGQFAIGENGAGLVFLLLAIGIGIPTAGIGSLIVGIISASSLPNAIWKCPSCKSKVDANAAVCKFCQTAF